MKQWSENQTSREEDLWKLGHFNNLNCTCISCEGAVKVWDPRQKDEPVVNMQPAEGEAKRDCWTVAFGKLI